MPAGVKVPTIKDKPVVKEEVKKEPTTGEEINNEIEKVKTEVNSSYEKNLKRLNEESAAIDEQFSPKSGGEALDKNGNPFGNGTLSPDGLLVAIDGVWVELTLADTNKDGTVSEEEMIAFEGSLDQDEEVVEDEEVVVEETTELEGDTNGDGKVNFRDEEGYGSASQDNIEGAFESGKEGYNPIAKAKSKAEKIAENYKKAVDEATKGIDSNRVLKNIGNNGFAAIGMALAIMGSALGGVLTGEGGNTALDAIDRIIDQDIADQKLDRDLKLKKAGTIKKDLDAALKDEQKQKTLDGLKKYKYLSAVRSQVEMKMYSTNDSKKKAAYKKQLDLIDKQLIKVYGDFTISVTQFVMKEDNRKAERAAKRNAAAKKEQEGIAKRTININGKDVIIKKSATPKKIAELQDKANSLNKSNKIVGQLLNIDKDIKAGKYGSWAGKFDKNLKAAIGPKLAFLKASIRVEVLGPGTVNDSEREILDNLVANPYDIQLWGSDRAKSALKSLQRVINSGAEADFKGWAEPGQYKDFKSTSQNKGLKNTKSVGTTRIVKDKDNKSLSVAKKNQRKTTADGEVIYDGYKWVKYTGQKY